MMEFNLGSDFLTMLNYENTKVINIKYKEKNKYLNIPEKILLCSDQEKVIIKAMDAVFVKSNISVLDSKTIIYANTSDRFKY